MADCIATYGGDISGLKLVGRYGALKIGVHHNTVAGYRTVINILKKGDSGGQRIDRGRLSDTKAWLIKLQFNGGRGDSSIYPIRGVLRPAFQMVVDDDLLRKNPFPFQLGSVTVNDSVKREAIAWRQEQEQIRFIRKDEHFCRCYAGIYILLHTGFCSLEFCGLTVQGIEFKEMSIHVDHQL